LLAFLIRELARLMLFDEWMMLRAEITLIRMSFGRPDNPLPPVVT
jgi:hypothetical protein